MTALRIAESHATLLPPVFRKDAVYQLAADTIIAIDDLSEKLTGTDQPFETLEREQPNWQEKLPLSFENANIKILVDGLLKKAKEKKRSPFEQLKIERLFIKNDKDQWGTPCQSSATY